MTFSSEPEDVKWSKDIVKDVFEKIKCPTGVPYCTMFEESKLAFKNPKLILKDAVTPISNFVAKKGDGDWTGISNPVGLIGRKYSSTPLHVEVNLICKCDLAFYLYAVINPVS